MFRLGLDMIVHIRNYTCYPPGLLFGFLGCAAVIDSVQTNGGTVDSVE